MAKRYRRSRTIESLESRAVLATDTLTISEFMAANSHTLRDEDGEYSDWIELYNPTRESISLSGWRLTDDAQLRDGWPLPDATLGPGQYRIVFASGKDRVTGGGVWHTDFRLDAAGEFLGLLDPSGRVVQQFTPTYPPQSSDRVYGLSIEQVPLISDQTVGKWYVPQAADAPLGSDWVTTEFVDASWRNSQGAVGYDERQGYVNFGFETGDLTGWETSGQSAVLTAAAGAEPTQGSYHGAVMATESSTTRFSLETFLGLSRADLNSVGNVDVTRGSAMRRTITVAAGSQLQFDWNFLTNEPSFDGSADFAFLSVSPGRRVVRLGGVAEATTLSGAGYERETGYRSFTYTFPEAGEFVIGLGVANVTNRFLDSSLQFDNLLIDGVGSLEDTFDALVQTDVAAHWGTQPGSLWTRYQFTAPDDRSGLDFLQLRLRYDDGYAAYLNGQRIAFANAAAAPQWDSVALADRADDLALEYEAQILSADLLQAGVNTLAVQLMRTGANDSNALLQVELTGLGAVATAPLFLSTPTPGTANVSASFHVAEAVQFSVEHGLYDQPFDLTLTTPTVGAEIRYTLDGSAPSATHGLSYTVPLRISATQAIRAVALKDGLVASRAVTQSYVFIENVISQSRTTALARDFPVSWGNLVATDYDMDRRIVGQNGTDLFGGVYADTVRDDLLALPSLSIVMDLDDLFGPTGIYSNPDDRGIEAERPTSLELIYPDGRPGFQIDAGIRVQGGISRFISSKLSFRLLFKDDYGPSKLEFPLFGEHRPSTFDSISLRSSSGEHLVGIHYIRDEFARRSQQMTGNVASIGNYMHLYINGLYWGVYNPVERIDGQFGANHYGGDKDDYDVLNAGDLGAEGVSAIAGSLEAWNRLRELAAEVEAAANQTAKTAAYHKLQGLNPDGTRNPEWEVYLDADNYIDYLITQVYLRNSDWPIRNYYMLRQRGLDSTGFKFYLWDSEFTLDQGTRVSLSSITREGPGELYQLLDTSEAFRVRFSDRVQEHFSPGGSYYVNPNSPFWDPAHPENNVPAALYVSVAEEVRGPLGPESARWGDELARNGRLFVRDAEWQQTLNNNLNTFFPTRSRDFLIDVRRLGFYRDAPTFSPLGGLVNSGDSIQIRPRSGRVYYTLDGSDPRSPTGEVTSSALEYLGPVTINGRTRIQARSLDGESWSALSSVTYVTDALPADPQSIRIAELNFNPHDALVAFGEASVDHDEFEFVELMNVSGHPVDLTGVKLVTVQGQGIQFEFGVQLLAAGQRVVIPRNREALVSRYGGELPLARGVGDDPNDWVFLGSLSNGGERLTLQTARGELAHQLTYQDTAPWPRRADGGGSSLQLLDPMGDGDAPTNYRASDRVGGSPGMADDGNGPAVRINEVLANPEPGGDDRIELANFGPAALDVGGWYLTDSDDELLKYRLPHPTRIEAGGYHGVTQDDFGFGINGTVGDDLYLLMADAAGRPERFVDEVRFLATN